MRSRPLIEVAGSAFSFPTVPLARIIKTLLTIVQFTRIKPGWWVRIPPWRAPNGFGIATRGGVKRGRFARFLRGQPSSISQSGRGVGATIASANSFLAAPADGKSPVPIVTLSKTGQKVTKLARTVGRWMRRSSKNLDQRGSVHRHC